jgi:hypothetical protein
VPEDCHKAWLGLKPSRKSVVPGGLEIFIARFPTVETVGFLLTSRKAGLGGYPG